VEDMEMDLRVLDENADDEVSERKQSDPR